jgi:hypothetical protein
VSDHNKPSDTDKDSYYHQPTGWRRFIRDVKIGLKERRAKRKDESAPDKAARRTATATVWIAIFAVVTAAVGMGQWSIQRGTLDEMQAEQRPFAFISGMKIIPNQGMLGKNLTWFSVVTWENSGNAPTRHLTVTYACPSYPDPDADPYVPPYGTLPWRPTRLFLGPKATANYGGCQYAPETMAATLAGKYRTYELAVAIYEDSSGKAHLTEYCANIIPGSGDWLISVRGAVPSYITDSCPVHNCADDECPAWDFQYAKSVLAKLDD